LAVLLRPDQLARARLVRRRARAPGADPVTPLLASSAAPLRAAAEATGAWLTGSAGSGGPPMLAAPGPTSEAAGTVTVGHAIGRGIRGLLRRPPVLLVAALAVVAVLACRDLLGSGRLWGGALLPAPDGAGDLWAAYTASWHGVGLGSDRAAPPYLAVLAALAVALLGKAGLAVDALLLGCVPLAGLTAYLALGAAVRNIALRLWGAAAYATLPVAMGAVAAGRLGTAVALVLLPLLGWAAGGLLAARRAPWSRAWLCGLLLALVTSFAPVAYAFAAILGAVAALVLGRQRPVRSRVLVVLAVPPALLLPWTLEVWRRPAALLGETGLPGPRLADTDLHPLAVVLLHPGGPGMHQVWSTAGLLLAAVAALLRPDRRPLLIGAWATAATGLVAGLALSRLELPAHGVDAPAPAWPGFATAVAGAGLVLAAVLGGEGLAARMPGWRFGLSQPLALLVMAAAAAVPVLAGAAWMARGAAGPIERGDAALLPAYVAAEAATPTQPRTLVLASRPGGGVGYAVVRGSGPRLGDAEMAQAADDAALLDPVVADVVSGRGGDGLDRLAGFAVRFVYATRPAERELVSTLDTLPGLTRVGAPEGAALWRLDQPVSQLRTVSAGGALAAAQSPVPAGDRGRRLVLAERADPGWTAQVNGRELGSIRADGWAQGFVLPEHGGPLALGHDRSDRNRWLLGQGAILLVVVLLAIPSARPAARASAVGGRQVPALRERLAPQGERGPRGAAADSGTRPPDARSRVGSAR
jgi:hypothetical protein